MFCRKCGEQINDNAKFCPKCGAQVAGVQQTARPQGGVQPVPVQTAPAQSAPRKVPYLAIGAIVIVAIVVFIAVRLLFGGGYKTPVKKLMKSIEKQDMELLVDTIPDGVMKALEDETGLDKKTIIKMFDSQFSSIADEYDGKIKIKYEIEDEHRLKKSEIKDIEDELFDSVDIKEGKRLEISTEIYIDGEEEEDEDLTLNVIKVGSKWYLDPSSIS